MAEFRTLIRRMKIPAVAAFLCVLVSFGCGVTMRRDPFSLVYEVPTGPWNFAGDFFLNGALAILIAAIATEVVERAARLRAQQDYERYEAQAKALTEASTSAVARNVWGADHSAAVLEENLATVFSSHLLREEFLHEVTFEAVPGAAHAVRCSQWIEYTVVNPSKSEESFDPVFSFDDTRKIYPNDPHLQRPIFDTIRIGDEKFPDERIARLNLELYGSDTDGLNGPPVSFGHYKIPHDGKVRVRITSNSVEPIDSHWINRVFVPNKGVCVVVHNRVGPSFKIHLIALFRGDFGPPDNISADGSDWERRYEGVILPQSGWALRWNDVERPVPGVPPASV